MKNLKKVIALMAVLGIGASAFAQQKISGTITDAQGPLVGASVFVQGTSNGTISGTAGEYSLSVPENSTVVVSCIGYTEQTFSVTRGNNVYNIMLSEDAEMLEETVVVGYGTMKKSDVTGAMVSIGSTELTKRPTTNILDAMQGKVAGVDIRTSDRPGSSGSVYIRGTRSIGASNSPLYVIDGVPMQTGSIDSFNTNDIESVDILKDASATAIYGSRGANGVILITTKKGEAGKMHVGYSGSLTVNKMVGVTEYMNSAEYIEYRRWARHYSAPDTYPDALHPTIENDKQIFLAQGDPYAWANIQKGWAGGTWDGSKVPTTDWLSLATRPAVIHEHTVNVSGGTDKIKSYTSFGYLDNRGSVVGQDYRRYTINTNNEYTPFKWINVGAVINASYGMQNYGLSSEGASGSGGTKSSIYAAAVALFPYAVPYDDQGNVIQYPGGDDRVMNIIGEWDKSTDKRNTFRVLANAHLQLNFGEMWAPLKGLSYRISFGPDFNYSNTGLFVDETSFNRGSTNYARKTQSNTFAWTLDNQINYNRTFGKHSIGVTLLQTASAYKSENMKMDAEALPYPVALWNSLDSVSSLKSWSSGLSETQMESYMARVNYVFNDRYLITASVRRDGASQLAEGHKWATFPSVALGWRIDQENFMDNANWVNQLKLRLGYGVTGNAAVGAYSTKGKIAELFYPFGTQIEHAYTLYDNRLDGNVNVLMANEGLTWEKTAQFNAGLDFGFLNGRIGGVLDVYKSFTSDLLMSQSLPSLIGYKNTMNNVGKTENFGVDITLNLVPVLTRDWEWTVDINAAYTRNMITELANGKVDDVNNGWFIGESLGSIYTYQSDGLWQAEDAAEMAKFNANGHNFEVGFVKPVDQNGDYKIDANNDRVIVGNTLPRWTFGFNSGLSYRNFTLDVQLYGRFGFKDSGSDAPLAGGRYTVRKFDYWTENNTDAKYGKPYYSETAKDDYYQIIDIRDRSFLKIRNVSLSYLFPSKVLKGSPISNLKLYVQGNNLGSIFNGSEARDMDTGSAYYNRGFIFGVNISF